jgi:hypothetical protein
MLAVGPIEAAAAPRPIAASPAGWYQAAAKRASQPAARAREEP